MRQTPHPPCRTPRCSYTRDPCRGSFRSSECVAGVSQLHPPKGPCRTSLYHRGGGAASAWALQNPVALQGVEQLHCSVSRYTSPLREGVAIHAYLNGNSTHSARACPCSLRSWGQPSARGSTHRNGSRWISSAGTPCSTAFPCRKRIFPTGWPILGSSVRTSVWQVTAH